MTATIHANSLAAYEQGQRLLNQREKMVYDWLKANGPATDRDVMHGLDFDDMNGVRPRITTLISLGYLIECGERQDEQTHRTVRVVTVTAKVPHFKTNTEK